MKFSPENEAGIRAALPEMSAHFRQAAALNPAMERSFDGLATAMDKMLKAMDAGGETLSSADRELTALLHNANTYSIGPAAAALKRVTGEAFGILKNRIKNPAP